MCPDLNDERQSALRSQESGCQTERPARAKVGTRRRAWAVRGRKGREGWPGGQVEEGPRRGKTLEKEEGPDQAQDRKTTWGLFWKQQRKRLAAFSSFVLPESLWSPGRGGGGGQPRCGAVGNLTSGEGFRVCRAGSTD